MDMKVLSELEHKNARCCYDLSTRDQGIKLRIPWTSLWSLIPLITMCYSGSKGWDWRLGLVALWNFISQQDLGVFECQLGVRTLSVRFAFASLGWRSHFYPVDCSRLYQPKIYLPLTTVVLCNLTWVTLKSVSQPMTKTGLSSFLWKTFCSHYQVHETVSQFWPKLLH